MKQQFVKQKPAGYVELTSDVFFKRYCVKNDPVLYSLMSSYLCLPDEGFGSAANQPQHTTDRIWRATLSARHHYST